MPQSILDTAPNNNSSSATPDLLDKKISCENIVVRAIDLLSMLSLSQSYLLSGACPASVRDDIEDSQADLIAQIGLLLSEMHQSK